MALFKSREAQDIDAVRLKLESARAELDAQTQYLAEVALEAAMAEGDTPAVTKAQAKVRQLRDRIELLEAAITEAERLERSRLARARAEADATRLRALRQHIASATKAAREYEIAVANGIRAWGRLCDACESHNALLSLGEAQHKAAIHKIRPLALAQIAKADHAAGNRHAPGTPALTDYQHVVPLRQHVSETPDFSTMVEQRLLTNFKLLGGDK